MQSVDFAVHFGGDEDASDYGHGAETEVGGSGGGRGESALEEKPCEGGIAGVFEESFGECRCLLH